MPYSLRTCLKHRHGPDGKNIVEIRTGHDDKKNFSYASDVRVFKNGRLIRIEPATYLDTGIQVLWFKDKRGKRREIPLNKRRFNP